MLDNITCEPSTPPVEVPELDHTLFNSTEVEWEFLKTFVHKDDDEIRRRVLEIQKQAYDKCPYPCIRAFHFVALMMRENPAYTKILIDVENGMTGHTPIFLDLGCCMGSDVRKLVQDGYPAASIVGCDLLESFLELGHKLYNDTPSSLPIRFMTGDIFQLPLTGGPAPSKPLAGVTSLEELRGRVTYIYTGSLFHLFNKTTQTALAARLSCLLTRDKGAIIFGRHRGMEPESVIKDHVWSDRYGHSPNSWEKMWKQVFTETDGEGFVRDRLEVVAKISGLKFVDVFPTNHRELVWSVQI